MLERLNRNKFVVSQKHVDYIVYTILIIIAILLVSAIIFGFCPNQQQTAQQVEQTSSANDLITSWNTNQTMLNKDILSDVKATGSKVVDGTISSGTTITTTRTDFLFHLSNKTVVYISPAEQVSLKTGPTSNEITLTRPQKYSVIVDGITYTISVNDYRTSMLKLRNHSLIYVIWINDNYWWG
jgi:hypothetical protein